MYGTQANIVLFFLVLWFENDVKMYGTQARKSCDLFIHSFENDVKMYGTQARIIPSDWSR